MERLIQCCKNMDLELTPFRCFYLGVNWTVWYCQSCQTHFIRAFGLDIHHKGEPKEIMHQVWYDKKLGCWAVIIDLGKTKGYLYADN